MQGWSPSASNTINLVGLTRFLWFYTTCVASFSCITGTLVFDSALHLHPDKNKHPKAEIAFKLVSEVSL